MKGDKSTFWILLIPFVSLSFRRDQPETWIHHGFLCAAYITFIQHALYLLPGIHVSTASANWSVMF
jgi:hypothetical protein